MRLTQETDYALRLVLAFSQLNPESYLSAKDISDSQNIPFRFLLRVMKKLKTAGIVHSRQGVDGGYRLARPKEEISLKDVIEAIEGDLHITRCLKSVAHCNANYAPECKVHQALGKVQSALMRQLEEYNFGNI